jgi:polyhydroxyalkanoate synthesis regulator phasin
MANDLEHMGKGKNGKNDAISKLMNAIGSVPAAKNHMDAAKYREEAARLREQLAQIENQDKFSSSVPAP